MSDQSFCHELIEVWPLGLELTSKQKQLLMEQYRACRYRDAVLLELTQGELWIFDYGVMVGWGVEHHQSKVLFSELSVEPEPQAERYQFQIDASEGLKIRNDQVSLPSDDPLQRLALSHALAQSAKLAELEAEAQVVISSNRFLSQELAQTGHIRYGRKALAKLRGTLFETRSDILLHFGLLDTPEFFWDYPELESTYQAAARYLELTPRTELLNRKLETIHELVEMLASEQNHKHSSFLEWIIIILIAVEIVLFFVH